MAAPGRPAGRLGRALTVGVVLGATLVAPGTAPAVAPAHAVAQEPACDSPEKAFRPAALKIPGVVARTRVLARGRDRHGVPRPPPLTERGKWRLAWDKASRIRPGGPRGVVRLTAHTYPRSAGPALGNRLLRRLNEGDRLVVSGPGGERLCYQVVKRVRVRAERKLRTYYSSTGRPRLAILVCSGKRRGPGDWSHRTIWYAVPTSD